MENGRWEFTQRELLVIINYFRFYNNRIWLIYIKNNIFTDYLPKNYVGCFDDEIKKIKGKYLSYQMGYNSPRKCMNLCNTQQFSYAAIKGYYNYFNLLNIKWYYKYVVFYSNVCECKNYEPNYNLQKSFSDCNTLCPQNPYEYCGGGLTLQNIYKTLISAGIWENINNKIITHIFYQKCISFVYFMTKNRWLWKCESELHWML